MEVEKRNGSLVAKEERWTRSLRSSRPSGECSRIHRPRYAPDRTPRREFKSTPLQKKTTLLGGFNFGRGEMDSLASLVSPFG
jgi:hypothetical protein